MKRTLITIAVTTVVVLTLVGIVSSSLFLPATAVFSKTSQSLGYGGGGGAPDYYAQEAPAQPGIVAPGSAPLPSDAARNAAVASDGLITANGNGQVQAQERKVINNDQLS